MKIGNSNKKQNDMKEKKVDFESSKQKFHKWKNVVIGIKNS